MREFLSSSEDKNNRFPQQQNYNQQVVQQPPAQYYNQQPQQQQAPAGANPADPTGAGGGTIGVGQAPQPNEQGFTGNNEQGNIGQPQATGQPPAPTQ